MAATRLKIFISSVQKEFETVRRDLKAFLMGEPTLSLFVEDVFLFEELPAADRQASQVYLSEVERCDIYLGIFGYEYGSEDGQGVSPTEREYNCATSHKKTRLIYIWGADEDRRAQKMKKLIQRASGDLIRRCVVDSSALNSEVYRSIVHYLRLHKILQVPPFDTAPCDGATLADVSSARLERFTETARRKRAYMVEQSASSRSVLTHLNLLAGSHPTNTAILLFGSNPQRFHRPAETKCVSCHGTEYIRPFASQQVYAGDLFQQLEQACDFVLSKINRAVGTRAASNAAPSSYELPEEAVVEAIINALAHRDYYSNASVEVRLFADRLEVWNPGALPGTLTIEDLSRDHPSVPNNPLIAEPLFLSGYIEKAGSGTQRMIKVCLAASLPAPTFEQRQGSFIVTLWRDWLTGKALVQLQLNERQTLALGFLKTNRRISNPEYQKLAKTTKKTATRDLADLREKGVVEQRGERGPGVHYVLASKRDKKRTMGT
jgi:predicted HTH transcriptional regulator